MFGWGVKTVTVDELAAVVEVAGKYRLAILTWYYTGLRRAELERLEWGDIRTPGQGTVVVRRASTTKLMCRSSTNTVAPAFHGAKKLLQACFAQPGELML